MAITDASSALVTPGFSVSDLSASSVNAGYPVSYAVDNSMNPTSSSDWRSATSSYNSTTGINSSGKITTYNGSLTASGEWLQIKLSSPVVIKYYHLSWYFDVSSSYTTIPKEWYILGSPDGSTWSKIDYFNYGTSSAPINTTQLPFLIKLQNVYSNIIAYQYYRIVIPTVFGGGSLTYARVSEFDLFQENATSTTISRFIKPIVTPTHVLYPTSIIPFSNATSKQTVYLATDLYGNPVSNNTINNGSITNGIIKGAGNKAITSTCFDGNYLITTPINGNICYMNTPSLNTNLNFDISFNGTLISSGISGNVLTSCYNGKRVLLGGNGGNVITYNTIGTIPSPVWNATLNANALFTTVYHLASNPGYGPIYTPNRIYFSPGDNVSIVAPKAYNINLTSNTAISMSLNNSYLVQNVVLPTQTVIQTYFGATGPTGPQGAGDGGAFGTTGPNSDLTGTTGPTGPTGPNGIIGFIGVTGPTGPTGQYGITGITGFLGMYGPQGETGMYGSTGPHGQTGPTGEDGEPGPTGEDGESGPTGINGPMGDTGATGPMGDTGVTGQAGVMGPDGAIGPMNYDQWNTDIYGNITNLGNISIGQSITGIYTIDVSGNTLFSSLTTNEIQNMLNMPISMDISSVLIDYTLGETYYVDASMTFIQNFSTFVMNFPTQYTNHLYTITLTIDYTNSGSDRYYCNQMVLNGTPYTPYFENGLPILNSSITMLEQTFLIVVNSNVWNILGKNTSYI